MRLWSIICTFLLNLNCCSISFFMVNVSVSLTTVLAGNFNYSLCFVFMILYYVYYYSWAPNTNSLYVLNLVNFHNKVHCAIDSEWCMRPFVQGCINPLRWRWISGQMKRKRWDTPVILNPVQHIKLSSLQLSLKFPLFSSCNKLTQPLVEWFLVGHKQ